MNMGTIAVITRLDSSNGPDGSAWTVQAGRVTPGWHAASPPPVADLPDDVRAALVDWLGLTAAAEHWRLLTAQHVAYALEHDGAAMPAPFRVVPTEPAPPSREDHLRTDGTMPPACAGAARQAAERLNITVVNNGFGLDALSREDRDRVARQIRDDLSKLEGGQR